MCDGSRARGIARTWLGPWLAIGVGMAGTAQPVAMTAVSAGPQLPGVILIQQPTRDGEAAGSPAEPAGDPTAPDSFLELHEALAAARERLEELSRAAAAVAASGELQQKLEAAQEENERLRAEIEALRAERDELSAAQQAAEARAAESSRAAEQATAAAQEMDQELVAVRWQNAQLNTSLAQAQAKRDQLEAAARDTEALQAELEQLQAAAAGTTAEVARLRAELDEQERQLADAVSARAAAERQLAEWGERDQAGAVERLAAAESEMAALTQRVAALQDERDELRRQLADATERVEPLQAANSQLENQVDELRKAADAAADVARRNLLTVEDRLREINAALEATEPAGGPFEPGLSRSDRLQGSAAPVEPNDGAAAPADADSAATPRRQDAALDAEATPAEADLDRVKSARRATEPNDRDVALMLNGLPLEKRLHVQGLLAELDVEIDEQGLTTIVPGGLLFAVNSEAVQEGAYDTLAKVAELISVYDDRKVLIVGHTDAIGDAAYNKQLSERRAELVKQFFVDNFEVEEGRLATQGLGEERPIASDATREGRRANRRVEVLILN